MTVTGRVGPKAGRGVARRAAVLALLILAGKPAFADEAASAAMADTVNGLFREIYADTRGWLLARTEPVIVVAFDELVLIRDGRRETVAYTPRAYHDLKSLSHIALGVYGASLPALLDPAETRWRGRFERLAVATRQGEAAVDGFPVAEASKGRLRTLMQRTRTFLEASLGAGAVTRDTLTAYARSVAPLVLAAASDAAALQLDGLHAVVQRWRADLGPEAWAKTYVLVLGAKMPRDGNAAFQYFEQAMGRDAVDRRLIYTEGIFSTDAAMQLLGVIVLDRGLSTTFFNDEMRMDRDLLADGATHHLLTLFGRLGGD